MISMGYDSESKVNNYYNNLNLITLDLTVGCRS